MADVVNGGGDSSKETNGVIASSPPSQTLANTQQSSTDTMAPSQPNFSRPPVPRTSLEDDGHSKRPRDARIMHTILVGQGISAYQERVPLQLLDFAYRHTSSILSDALHLSSDAYVSQQTRARDAPAGGALRDADNQINLAAIKLAIESRQQYQYNTDRGGLARPFMAQLAEERNKVALPKIAVNEWGVRLPAEKFVLTGIPWGLKDEWEEVAEEEQLTQGDTVMNGMGGTADEEEGMEGAEEGEGNMEDLFGGNGDDGDKDVDME